MNGNELAWQTALWIVVFGLIPVRHAMIGALQLTIWTVAAVKHLARKPQRTTR